MRAQTNSVWTVSPLRVALLPLSYDSLTANRWGTWNMTGVQGLSASISAQTLRKVCASDRRERREMETSTPSLKRPFVIQCCEDELYSSLSQKLQAQAGRFGTSSSAQVTQKGEKWERRSAGHK